jgi:DnaJ-class molecular chaperone
MTILRSPRYTDQKSRIRMVIVAAVILLAVGVWVSTQLGSDRYKVPCEPCGGDGMLQRPDDCTRCNGTGMVTP